LKVEIMLLLFFKIKVEGKYHMKIITRVLKSFIILIVGLKVCSK